MISDNEILFEFDCGDLWYRKNADKSEDIDMTNMTMSRMEIEGENLEYNQKLAERLGRMVAFNGVTKIE